MTQQTEVPNPWMGAWAQNMAPFMNAMFPGAPDASKPSDGKMPIEDLFAALNENW